jgi:predicted Ser/Thr protein kinase
MIPSKTFQTSLRSTSISADCRPQSVILRQTGKFEPFHQKECYSAVPKNELRAILSGNSRAFFFPLPKLFEMKQMHLFCGDPSNTEIQEICALASGNVPEGWQKIQTGSYASVFSSPQYFLKFFPRETWVQKMKIIFKAKNLRIHDSGSLVVRKERRMAAIGFLTATVVAHGRVCDRTFLLTRRIQGMTLRKTLLQSKGEKKFTLIQNLAEEIARMHSNGIYHGDLNANNIMVVEKDREFRFYFLDNEKNKFSRKTPHRRSIRNLSQLNYLILPTINNTDRIRFLNAYLTDRDIPGEKIPYRQEILTLFNQRKKRKSRQ